jgi:deleted-in-malignant-brain-tumors protein 1
LPTTSVGYRRASASLEQGATSQLIRMDNLACTGTESALASCSRATSHNCGHSEDIVLSCGSSAVGSATGSYVSPAVYAGGVTGDAAWVYRLTGGTSSTWGRLEVRQADSATWGVVCASGFGLTDARVACRSLGFTSTLAAFRATATSEQASAGTPALMAQLACTGTETSLHQCPTGTGVCSATSAVVLACGVTAVPGVVSTSNSDWQYRLAGGTASSGRLEVRPVGVSAFGTVCDDSFGSTDALVACRSLGFSTYSAYRTVTTSQRGATSQAILMDDVACSGSESELRYCRYTSSHNCGHSEDVYLACSGVSSGAPALTTASPASLVPWRYRLAGGAAANTGRLEVLGPSGSSATSYNVWGSVCDDGFSRVDAIVACRSLGLSSSPVSYRTARSALRGSSAQPILMDDLACTGSESRLDECSRSSRHNCVHSEDVELTCGSLAVPVRSTVRIGGNGWRSILASESTARITALRTAVQADVAQMLGVTTASVSVTRLALGSLIVDFEVNATSNDAAVALANTVNASTGRTFARAQAIYAADTTEGRSGETTTISDAAAVPELAEDQSQVNADSPSAKSNSDNESSCGTTCVVGVLIAVGLIVAVVCVIGFFLFRSNNNNQQQQQQQQQQAGQNPIQAQAVGAAPPAQHPPQYPYPPQQNDQQPIGAVGGVYDNHQPGSAPQQQPQYPYPPQQPTATASGYPHQQQPTYAYPPQQQQQPTPMTSVYGQPQQAGQYPQASPYAPPQQYGYPAQPAPGPQPQYGYPVQQQQQSMNASQNACSADVPKYPDTPAYPDQPGSASQQQGPMPGQPDDSRV